jgi:hypothetical protein
MLRDVLREKWIYTEPAQEGEGEREESLAHSVQQAFVQGLHQAHKEIVQELRATLLKIIRLRFPNALRLAKKQTLHVDDLAILRELIVKMSMAQTTEEAVLHLLDTDEDEDELE